MSIIQIKGKDVDNTKRFSVRFKKPVSSTPNTSMVTDFFSLLASLIFVGLKVYREYVAALEITLQLLSKLLFFLSHRNAASSVLLLYSFPSTLHFSGVCLCLFIGPFSPNTLMTFFQLNIHSQLQRI